MVEIDQTQLHEPEKGSAGNCLVACIASILEIPIQYIPKFQDNPRYTQGEWAILINEWLNCYGLEMNMHRRNSPPAGYSIISGKSPRNEGLHACVALNGNLVFDPHPSRSGILDVRDYITIDHVEGE